ncbi:hypothetical protein J132_06538 [Termitomyces sp. J132]|nr:hypothetical protein J132_06538 [Termitomyces sp. J132]
MLTSDPTYRQLRIWQQNLAKLRMAQLNLLNSNTLHKEWDLILIQEPYIDKLNNTRASSAWRVIYPTSHLTNNTCSRLVILVNRQMDTNGWHQLTIPDSADVTAIQIKGNSGKLSVFNIYNDCKNNNSMDVMRGYLACNQTDLTDNDNDYMLWAGDFNRHHPLWDHERNRHLFTSAAEKAAQVIIVLTADYDMTMLLPRGIDTLRARRTGNWTRLDNVFSSGTMEDLVVRCEASHRNQGPCMDHVPIHTIIKLPTQKKAPTLARNF